MTSSCGSRNASRDHPQLPLVRAFEDARTHALRGQDRAARDGHAAAQRARPRARHRIEVDVPDDELWFDADESQFRQVVWNLATNALRAMPDGGRVWLRATHAVTNQPRAEGHAVTGNAPLVLEVRDEGVGFRPRRSTAFSTPSGPASRRAPVSDWPSFTASSAITAATSWWHRPSPGTTIRVTLPPQALPGATRPKPGASPERDAEVA